MELILKGNKEIVFASGSTEISTNDIIVGADGVPEVLSENDDFVQVLSVIPDVPLGATESLSVVFSRNDEFTYTNTVALNEFDGKYKTVIPTEVINTAGLWYFQILRRRYKSAEDVGKEGVPYVQTAYYTGTFKVAEGLKYGGNYVTAATIQTWYGEIVESRNAAETSAKNAKEDATTAAEMAASASESAAAAVESAYSAQETASKVTDIKTDIAVLNNALVSGGITTEEPTETAYNERITADGLNIIDGSKAVLKKVVGSTVVVDGELKNASFAGIESTGRNLVHFQDRISTSNGVKCTIIDGVARISGTTAGANAEWYVNLPKLAAGTYTYHLNASSYAGSLKGTIQLRKRNSDGVIAWYANLASDSGKGATFTVEEDFYADEGELRANIFCGNKSADYDLTCTPMLNAGTTALDFTPYIEPSVLNFPKTELGEGDEIDFERKVIIRGLNTETPTETPFTAEQLAVGNEYRVYSGGTESVLGNDNAEYGAINTLTQNYTVVDLNKDESPLVSIMYDSIAEHNLLVGNFPVEIGGFSIGSGLKTEEQAWNYNDTYNATKRVRIKQGHTVKLGKGDVFGLTDYTDARFYIGYRGIFGDGLYLSPGQWYTEDFTAPIDGEYVFTLSNITERVQTNADDLGKLVFVKKAKYEMQDYKVTNAEPKKIKSINHRGYNRVAPENTLQAFKLSKKNGFDFVECDVRWTVDGVPVLLHDVSINRTARNADGTEISGTVNIADITYEQALTYDFGIWQSAEYAGAKIPTFEEFISLCRNIGLHPYIEIESDTTPLTAERAQILLDIVKKYGMLDSVTWIGFDNHRNSLIEIVNAYKYARIGLLAYDPANHFNKWSYMQTLKTAYNEVFYNVRYDSLTEEIIANCKKFGIPLETWCPATVEIITACDPYISGFTTDVLNAEKVLYDAYIE